METNRVRNLNNIAKAVDEYCSDSVEEISSVSEMTVNEEFIVIDWRECDDVIVELVAEKIGNTEQLSAEFSGNHLLVTFNDKQYRFPLTKTDKDRYVTISSLAWLLCDRYDFWLLASFLVDDTHLILITTKAESDKLREEHKECIGAQLVPLQLGFDYFNQVSIPYLEHENDASTILSENKDQQSHSKRHTNKPWWKIW